MNRKHRLALPPIAVALSLVVGLAPPTAGNAAARSAAMIQPIIALDRARIVAHAEEELFVLIRFEIPEPVRARVDRPPLDLALVIDRSGSMAERGKITHARDASYRLVDAMAASDVLGVVEYDDESHVLWPASRLRSPELVKDLIAGLEPRGSTNLAGGLLQGIEEVRRHASRVGINRVFLFSDGLANRGITSAREIAAIVRMARREGISVSTLGLGLEYNEDLMQTIAEAGGGNYYYVESPSQMAAIFEHELSTLFTTVATDVRLHLEFGPGVRKVEALGYDLADEDGRLSLPLENLYGGEKRAVLLRLRLDPRETGSFDLGALHLGYTDCESNASRSATFRLRAEATEDRAAVRASVDREVSAEATLMAAEKDHEQCVRDYERGEKDRARRNLAILNNRIFTANQTFQDKRLEKKIEQLEMELGDMDRADLNEANRQRYLKGSKNRFYNSMKGKRQQYMLQESDAGFEVERLQVRLRELHLYSGPVDGRYTTEVRAAVETYQSRNGLDSDGIAGPATLRSLKLY